MKWLAFGLKFAISVGLVVFLLSRIDLSAVPARLMAADVLPIAAAAMLILLQMLLGALRWQAALVAIDAPLGLFFLVRTFYIGAFFSQALPSSVGGDAVRIFAVWRAGLEVGSAVTGVVLERVATVVALVFVVAVALPLFLGRVDAETAHWWPWAVALTALAAAAGLAFLMVLDRVPERLRTLRMVRGLEQVARDTRRLFLHGGHATRVLGWAALGHINMSLAVYALAVGLGISVDVLDCIALVPPVLLLTTLPISIGGWGVRESAMVTAFAAVGVSAESALVLSILLGLVIAAVSLPGGLVWLLSGERRASAQGGKVELDPLAAQAEPPGGLENPRTS